MVWAFCLYICMARKLSKKIWWFFAPSTLLVMRDKTRKKETIYRNYMSEYLSVYFPTFNACVTWESTSWAVHVWQLIKAFVSFKCLMPSLCICVLILMYVVQLDRESVFLFRQSGGSRQPVQGSPTESEGEKKKLSISPAAVRAKKQRFTLAWDRAREGSCEREDGPPGLPGRQVEKEKERILFTGTVYSLFGPSRNQAYKLTLKHHMV